METAKNSIETFNSIIILRKDIEENKIILLGKRIPKAMALLQYLYGKPIVDTNEVAKVLEVDISTAHRLINDFQRLEILKEQTGFKRNRIFVFESYLNLFERKL